jgi:hypothetical protein
MKEMEKWRKHNKKQEAWHKWQEPNTPHTVINQNYGTRNNPHRNNSAPPLSLGCMSFFCKKIEP